MITRSLFIGITLLILAFVAAMAYVKWYFRWEAEQTQAMAYFGAPVEKRRALKGRIRRHSRPIMPLVRLLASANAAHAAMPSFEYDGVCGPPKVSAAEVFERAKRYRPRPQDVFIATQMRCGTTWMQQLVFQTVTRGRGELSDRRYGHLYAVSPWIDAFNTVSIDEAPLVGNPPTRIIKTHLPTALCPYSPNAKYIYVTRHPVSCFASIVDYNRSLVGPFMPTVGDLAKWFCSDRMYWLPWPRHVEGWWEWAEKRTNVLFIHYEEMTRSFAAAQRRIEQFLGCVLTEGERREVAEKCSFDYMKRHEELFEMAPPTMFSVLGGEYLKSGTETRYKDVSDEVRGEILDYCRRALAGARYPAGDFYPELEVRAVEAV